MLQTILNKSQKQHSTEHQLYGHQIRRIRRPGLCWRSKDEPISDVLRWTPLHGRASVGRSTRTYLQQLCTDTGCSLEDLPEAMDDKDEWRERVTERESQGNLCQQYMIIYIYIYIFTNPSARAGYDTRSIFKQSLTCLNPEFSFSYTSCFTKAEEPSLSYYLPIAGGRVIGFIHFPRVLVLCEMQCFVQDLDSCRRVHFLRR